MSNQVQVPKSKFRHIEYVDINDDGLLEEIAVVKRWDDGSLAYIEIALLDKIDKERVKAIVTGPHSDRYELWELMDQVRLKNGLNALKYFHSNLVKIKRAEGSAGPHATYRGLDNVRLDSKVLGGMVGSEFSDPSQVDVAEGHERNLGI